MRFYFGERDRDGDRPLDVALMEACARRGVRAAALLRGVEGFGASARLRTDRLLSLSEDAPLVAMAVGDAVVVEGLAVEIEEMAGDGLVVMERVPVVVGPAAGGSTEGAPGDVVKVTIWGPRTGPRSPHLSAVAALHRCGAVAATVLLGVDGVLDGERRRARFVAGNRGVPAITVAVGEMAKVEAALAALDRAPSLVTVEPVVTFCRIATESHHGNAERLAAAEGTRTTLVTSEVASHDGRPTYLGLIDALRREGAAGATALRGVWGFRGSETPHGDRALALRRDVPMLVEVVDAPERAERWRDLALSLADGDDVVYSEPIPRVSTLD
jgi:PII-like signaling protein